MYVHELTQCEHEILHEHVNRTRAHGSYSLTGGSRNHGRKPVCFVLSQSVGFVYNVFRCRTVFGTVTHSGSERTRYLRAY